jgi:hypothetical protein
VLVRRLLDGVPMRVDHRRSLPTLLFEVERRVSLDPAWVEGVCVMRNPVDGSGGPAGGGT